MHGNRFLPPPETIDYAFEEQVRRSMIDKIEEYKLLLSLRFEDHMQCILEEDPSATHKRRKRKGPPVEKKRLCVIEDKKLVYYRSSRYDMAYLQICNLKFYEDHLV